MTDGVEGAAQKGAHFISEHAIRFARLFLIMAMGVAGFFSRAVSKFQENQVMAQVLGRFGLPWNFANLVDIAAALSGGLECMVGAGLFVAPYAISGDSKEAHLAREGAKWILQPSGMFLIGRGAELVLISIIPAQSATESIKSKVTAMGVGAR